MKRYDEESSKNDKTIECQKDYTRPDDNKDIRIRGKNLYEDHVIRKLPLKVK